jgi:putative transposase
MAQQAVQTRGMTVRVACAAFAMSQTCYRYQAKLSDENADIADWLLRLTSTYRNNYPNHWKSAAFCHHFPV